MMYGKMPESKPTVYPCHFPLVGLLGIDSLQ